MSTLAPRASQGRTVLGHPPGLFVLFFAEMWERFSFYGMRAILVFYLTKHFLFDETPAYAIYGAYTSLVYITPVIGGYLADRYLGARKAVLFGGLFIAIGHLLIAAAEGPAGTQGGYLSAFYLALAFIIVGTGFLKANVASIVGELYPRDDMRRDPAYSIFYMGINVGGMIGPLICGYLGEKVGWSWGFGAAGIGMLLGLANFVIFRSSLGGAGEPRDPVLLRARGPAGISREWTIYATGAVAVLAAWWLVRNQAIVGWLLLAFAVLTFAFIVWRSVLQLPQVERDRIFAALFLIALNPLFWALFEQAGSSLNTFTDQRVDRSLFGYQVPASWFQSINSFFIIVFAPLFAGLWTWLGRRRLEPNTPAKFGIGLALVGAGFLALVAGNNPSGLTSAWFIVLIYLLHTFGELCFSPVGLSAMTRLSVASMTGLMMGTWYLATAGGEFLAGQIAQLTGGENVPAARIIHVYSEIGWVVLVAGVIVVAVSPLIARLMHLDALGADPVAHGFAGENEIGEPAATGTRTGGELRP